MKKKVALVYDRINKWGGAERVLLILHKMFPEAPLYTSVYNPQTAPWAKVFEIKTSFLQKIPFFRNSHEYLAPLMPMAFESFNFDEYDLVISVTSEAAKGIITKPKTTHLCYCLTPTRYLWSGEDEYREDKSFKLSKLLRLLKLLKIYDLLIYYLKFWDKIAAGRPDKYIAISKTVAERIKRYYGREAEVVYPPITRSSSLPAGEAGLKAPRPPDLVSTRSRTGRQGGAEGGQGSREKRAESYFLVVSRLVAYKRIDLAIKACAALGLPLKIAGEGNEEKNLKKTAGKTGEIEFLGPVSEEKLGKLYQNCAAVIFPGEEDFGLVPLEAASYGKPVIAYKGGGVLETVIEGKTGAFFYPQTVEALIKRLKDFKPDAYDRKDCENRAAEFYEERFIRGLEESLRSVVDL